MDFPDFPAANGFDGNNGAGFSDMQSSPNFQGAQAPPSASSDFVGTPVLATKNLTKRYGSKLAVDNVSLSVNKGDIYGLVGLNGSGKTTLIRLVTSLIKKTSGSFELFGRPGNSPEHLTRISSMIEKPALYNNLSAGDNLTAQCGIVGVMLSEVASTRQRLLELVGLADVGEKKAGNFSLGMKQRLGIAMALVGNPEFMLLDEPTNGLDPAGIAQIRELLLKVNREQGITILVCSHILVELSKMATRYGFIHHGKLIHEITSEALHKTCCGRTRMQVSDQEAARAAFAEKGIEIFTTQFYNTFEIAEQLPVSQIYAILAPKGVEILQMQSSGGDLEGYFGNLINKYDAARGAAWGGMC